MAGMSKSNIKPRIIFTGDNLDVLQGFNSDVVDLIYLDPPFNSNQGYSAPIGSKAAGAAFKDTWTWDDVKAEEHSLLADEYPAVYALVSAAGRSPPPSSERCRRTCCGNSHHRNTTSSGKGRPGTGCGGTKPVLRGYTIILFQADHRLVDASENGVFRHQPLDERVLLGRWTSGCADQCVSRFIRR